MNFISFKKDTNEIDLVSLTSAIVDTCSSVSYVSYPQTEKSAMCMASLAFYRKNGTYASVASADSICSIRKCTTNRKGHSGILHLHYV